VAVALLTWGPACNALKDRDLWIGWSPTHRAERLKLVVQNRRFALLSAKGAEPNLASQSLAAALRAVPEHWHERFGYRPLLAETFSNPESHEGTCYKASNWIAVGTTAGYARHRTDRYIRNDSTKKLWLYSLHAEAKRHLCAVTVPAECARAMGPAATGTLPLREPQMESLWECLCRVPDPRSRNARFRIGSVLTIIAMALDRPTPRRSIVNPAAFFLTTASPDTDASSAGSSKPERSSLTPSTFPSPAAWSLFASASLQPRCSLRFALPKQKTLVEYQGPDRRD